VDVGLDVLVRHGHLARATEFHAQRLAFDRVPRLLERGQAGDSRDLGEVEVKAARAAWFTGDTEAAAAALEAAAKGCVARRDIRGLVAAVSAATDMDLDERARWYTIAAMQEAQRVQPVNAVPANVAVGLPMAELFQRARFRDAERAAAWWQVLRQRFPKDPAAKTLGTLRAIDERKMSGQDLQALCDASRLNAVRRPPEIRDAQLELIADTLADAGRLMQATERYVELSKVAASSPARTARALSRLAAFRVEGGRFREAADRYWDAWQADRGNPVPLYLSGWALAQSGETSIGGQRMARAHLIPLSDQNARFDLYETLLERKRTAEATRERDVILRTAEFLSWRRSEALRRAGDEAHAAGDAARAADLWERAFLDNNSEQTKFVEPWANVSMPALVRRTRAVGLIRAGDVAAGVREAEASLAMSPGDADCLIDAVNALDETGHKDDADALYARGVDRYRKLCDAHPKSGPLHNLRAWAAAKCRRELDGALAHARRAVELQPTNTASLDTLAEAHFQRGEFAEAISVMRRCAELEPDESHHKEQLERFGKALAAAATRPSPK
jgi:tetratricopeptide (TPR) repeat protein